jgi:N-glycosylase/DNA lyase
MKLRPSMIEAVVRRLCPAVEAVLRAKPARLLSEQQLWFELSLCILSSRVPFRIAVSAAKAIKRDQLFTNPEASKEDFVTTLTKPMTIDRREIHYRFPNVRGAQLYENKESLAGQKLRLLDLVSAARATDPSKARVMLVTEISGFGPKQASMFLRNVRAGEQLAILDSHVLTYLRIQRVVSKELPTSMRLYERIEARFSSYARELGFSLECTDIAVWTTMQAAAQMGLQCR